MCIEFTLSVHIRFFWKEIFIKNDLQYGLAPPIHWVRLQTIHTRFIYCFAVYEYVGVIKVSLWPWQCELNYHVTLLMYPYVTLTVRAKLPCDPTNVPLNQSPTQWPALTSRIDLCQRLTNLIIVFKVKILFQIGNIYRDFIVVFLF